MPDAITQLGAAVDQTARIVAELQSGAVEHLGLSEDARVAARRKAGELWQRLRRLRDYYTPYVPPGCGLTDAQLLQEPLRRDLSDLTQMASELMDGLE